MKRFFGLFFVISMLFAIPAQAQFKFGVKAGVNLAGAPSDIEDINGLAADGTTGFFVGPMAKFTIPLLGLGIEADALYSRTGAEIAGEKINKNSIEIPVYLRYDFALPLISKVAVPFLAVGPQFGFAFGSTDEMTDWGKYEYKKSNMSLNLGAGAILLSKIQLHINYNIALGKTSELSGISGAWEGATKAMDSKTNTWQISTAYLF
ncbi:MAG: porin family protein [Bacteroidaceae bacterium]|nr:porin family protein [Bacteroidaceae bacterium]